MSGPPVKTAFVTSHPIQYQIPVFRELFADSGIDLTVLFCHLPNAAAQGDGFGVAFEWDLPLLEGYRYEVLENVASEPSVTRFAGCDTPGVRDVLRRGGYDAVVVNGWNVKAMLQTRFACHRLGIPCVVRGEANDLRIRPWWVRRIQSLLVNRYAACCPIGTASRAFYQARGVPDRRLFNAPYCVENDRFAGAAAASTVGEARARFGLPEDRMVALFSGKFETKKRPLDFLKALAAVADAGAAAPHALLVGDGPLRGECEAFAHARALPATFAGFVNQSEIPLAYRAADVLVLPSDAGETWGLVVNEAMACGRPAIVSDRVGCGPDLIEAEGAHATGAIFPLGDVPRLAQLLSDLEQDRDRLRRMGAAARERVARYSPATAAEGLAAAVQSVSDRTVKKRPTAPRRSG
ncbi:glycosyltransferase family 4 protein [Alienimonas chondri]|uniref:D-inositol-3-phosphate glycosyltransferase n=1 Tax=Alienimonas chondri TaxID=2681879 RepID=A0ABX1VFS7_9PLAN|nr:glycosyltransferase family 4 protein [Alienimonas chondri]NNJ26390.1 D-inositol-3-phosphate glycosyltransferase [Alienimonas chondri]